MRKAAASVLVAPCSSLLPGCRKKETAPDPKQLIADLRGPDAEKSGRARLLLITLGEPAVPDLAELLRSGSPAERVAAANTLWGMGARARAAVPDLAAALARPGPRPAGGRGDDPSEHGGGGGRRGARAGKGAERP